MPTINEVFQKGKSILQGLPQPSLEAKLFLLYAAQISEEQFYTSPEKSLSRTKERRFFQLINKRLAGFPLAYLTGFKEFWSIPLNILPGVLIPRPETELIVEKVLEFSSGGKETIVDIGTGSGNIAVALAKELPKAHVLATDISKKALEIARINASEQQVNNITFAQGSLFIPLDKLSIRGKCDFIVSNPPYVSENEWNELPVEIKDHEPKKSLVAGKTGLEVIEKIIHSSPPFLKPGGRLIIEIGEGQKDRVINLFGAEWREVQCFDDLNGIPRVLTARLEVRSEKKITVNRKA